eukprot:10890769-Lingulodinium_polyedra.AAC.1
MRPGRSTVRGSPSVSGPSPSMSARGAPRAPRADGRMPSAATATGQGARNGHGPRGIQRQPQAPDRNGHRPNWDWEEN